MTNFLIFITNLTPFTKKDIDEGNTPPDIYKLCVGIREAFCISYYIRKENNLYFYIEENRVLIKFIGNELRYLGSDERSQALLLSKAINRINSIENNWTRSTPGIYVRKLNDNMEFIHFLFIEKGPLIFLLNNTSPFSFPFLYHTQGYPKVKKLYQIKDLKERFFIIPSKSSDNKKLVDILKVITQTDTSKLEIIYLTSLDKINSLGDKILYTNFQIDRQEMIKK